MKYLVILSVLISTLKANADVTRQVQGPISQDRMQQVTLEAIARFYGLDIIGQEAVRRIQEKYIPKEMKAIIPYTGLIYAMTVEQRIVFRMEF